MVQAWLGLLVIFLLCSCTSTTVRDLNLGSLDPAQLPEEQLRQEEQKRLESLPAEQLVQLGRGHLASGAIPLARLYFVRALKKSPDSAPALVGLAETFERGHDLKKATGLYGVALKHDPDHVPALVGLGRVLRNQGARDQSLENLVKAMQLEDRNPLVLGELAITYEALGMEPLAEPLHREVVTLRPHLAAAHNNLGFNYLLQKRYDEAIAAFSRALNIEPENSLFKNNLGAAYALHGDEGKALQVFQTAMDQASAYNNLGYLYMTDGQYDQAEKAFKRALDLKPVFYLRAQENLNRLQVVRKAAR
ncbi:hypothetical protein DESUT3_05270 [Desulfuromonas versatilis]|uniref:Tetratricopeptide repeat protein n=1 Tax=Desulfuromonas versatilis TaxID=2802975 RepID=A0ABM7N8T1_9BACT|nr:tetratricopeptide repeat protein [Desulfuromonas versatilis]BCR03458.1 hypothetical protein DESUT3_05270 [Desulfuromonas versatilis]